MAQKYYLVRFSDGTIQEFSNWDTCKKAVHGVKNVQFKGFPIGNRTASQNWLTQLNKTTTYIEPPPHSSSHSSELRLFVDGSFSSRSPYAGWGWVAIKGNDILQEGSGRTKEKAISRNIDGELEATLQGLQWLSTYLNPQNKSTIYIVYDYAGIAHWALGTWKAKSVVAQQYVKNIQILLQKIPNIIFEKVQAHTGQRWNEYADKLAKEGIL